MDGSSQRDRLATLPPELFDPIVANLEQADLKALRLTGINRDSGICKTLFRRVRLSHLQNDFDIFCTVASRPHLVRHVRQLDWATLPADLNDAETWAKAWCPSVHSRGERRRLAEMLLGASWIQHIRRRPLQERGTGSYDKYMRALDKSRPQLEPALQSMPHLRTLSVYYNLHWRNVGIQEPNDTVQAMPPPSLTCFLACYRGPSSVVVKYIQTILEHAMRTAGTATLEIYVSTENNLDKVQGHKTISYHSLPRATRTLAKVALATHLTSLFSRDDFALPLLKRFWASSVPFSPQDLETIVSAVSKTIECLAFKKCDMTTDHVNVLATLPSLHLHQFVVLESQATVELNHENVVKYINDPMVVDLAAVG